MSSVDIFGVRRFTTRASRGDNRCFEIFVLKTGECASFPGTKKDLDKEVKARNKRAELKGGAQ